ncbi:MAG: DUF4827 domain-containing protein [Prevotella sp.]
MKIRNITLLAVLLCSITTLFSCKDSDTYADQKERERSAISKYIRDNNIKVISEEEFLANDTATDLKKNEFVLFKNTGVYMQIVNKGAGEILKHNESATVLCRYKEINLLTDSLQTSNLGMAFSSLVDKMTVRRYYSTYSASFDKSSSLMARVYNSTSVPNGWLVPLAYIKLGRLVNDTDSLAKVNLIVPHSEGQVNASQRVYPCFYTITYQRGK